MPATSAAVVNLILSNIEVGPIVEIDGAWRLEALVSGSSAKKGCGASARTLMGTKSTETQRNAA